MTATMAMARNNLADPKINYYFGLSLLFHLMIVAGMILGAFRNPHPNFKFDSMQVQLMSAGQLPPAGNPDAKNMAMALPKGAPPPPAKKVKPSLPADATKEDLPKKKIDTQVSDADRQKLDSVISQLTKEVGRSDRAGENAEWNALMGEINGDLGKRAYYERAAQIYKQSWVAPMSVPASENIVVRVAVRIDPEGKVIDYEVLNWSNNRDFDRSVKRALDSVTKLPPPPVSGSQWMTIPFAFKPTQEE
jgi:TonB family protein